MVNAVIETMAHKNLVPSRMRARMRRDKAAAAARVVKETAKKEEK